MPISPDAEKIIAVVSSNQNEPPSVPTIEDDKILAGLHYFEARVMLYISGDIHKPKKLGLLMVVNLCVMAMATLIGRDS